MESEKQVNEHVTQKLITVNMYKHERFLLCFAVIILEATM
jgi:hypothetical protein